MNQGWKPVFFFANGTSSKDGMGTVQSMNKSAVFGDQSSSSRVDQLRNQALNAYKLSQPKSGPVKNEKEKNSRLDAITRVRAGGYVPPKNTKSIIF
jgi:hypothetical protein